MDSAEHISQTLNLEQLTADFRLFGAKLDYIAEELKSRPTLAEVASVTDFKIAASEAKIGERLKEVKHEMDTRIATWEELINRMGKTFDDTMIGFTDKITRQSSENETLATRVKEVTELAQKAFEGVKTLGSTLGEEIKRLASIVDSWSGIQQSGQSQINTVSNQSTAHASELRRLDGLLQDTDVRTGQMFDQFKAFGGTLSTFDTRIRNMESRQESIFIFVSNLDEREKARVERNKRIIQYIRSLRGMTTISVSSAPFLISLAQTVGVNDRAEEFIWILEQFFSHF